ncbi:MAG: class I SAM-dependent methyltransferase [Syntrophales bacterium]|jgi:ubiquinone/menaquinone biosynthesis C-methylase UbiE|nr:class I SAM-dependent methyltransferase [Syntrophales bacterium]MCK9527622.1 class I SAM-dependent methyltransferase [Syntrophales bacterium]MDX9922239.1 class I SAM-dependent methyltransferase [Syntrophales bacterium]
MKDIGNIDDRYLDACREVFWQKVFQHELEYLALHLKGCRDVLSIGCGPAVIEGGLAALGFNVTGVDVSREALNCAPDNVRTVVARAEDMSFPDSSFDAAIYVASLQFVGDYRAALERTTRVLRPHGRIIIMLLNTESDFVKKKSRDPDSYMHMIKHRDVREIEDVIAEKYSITTEYFLGVKDDAIFESKDANGAALYIIRGTIRSSLAGNRSL